MRAGSILILFMIILLIIPTAKAPAPKDDEDEEEEEPEYPTRLEKGKWRKNRYCPFVNSTDTNFVRYVHNGSDSFAKNYSSFELYCEYEFNKTLLSDRTPNNYTCVTLYHLPFFKQCVFSKATDHHRIDWYSEMKALQTYCFELDNKYSNESCRFNASSWTISAGVTAVLRHVLSVSLLLCVVAIHFFI